MQRLRRPFLIGLLGLFLAVFVLPYAIPLPAQPDRDPAALLPANGRFVTVNGFRTVVVEVGPATGPAVVLIHGFGGSTFSWRSTLPALAAAGYHAIALDLKGFGLSDKIYAEDYSHAAQAAFVAGVMDALAIERAVLVGHSMGGSVIGHFAFKYPARTAGLVFVDGAVFVGESNVTNTRTVLAALTAVPPLQRWGQIIIRSLATPERVTESLRTAYADPAFVTPAVAEGYLIPQTLPGWDLALMGIMRDSGQNALPGALADITAPTLIAWGQEDTWVSVSRGEALREGIPGAQWAVFPHAGHLPMEEQAEAFNARLLEFLESLQ